MDADQKQKVADEARIVEAKAVEEEQVKAKNGICEQLSVLKDFLLEQSAFDDDELSWAAGCLQLFLEGKEKTLDHAFGLRSSKTGRKPMQSGVHDDWVAEAWAEVILKTPSGKDWPDTETMAGIGRCFGLGGKDSENAESHGIASELKRILKRYSPIIIKQISDELNTRLNKEE